jgi:hypothetical protein
MHASEYDDGPLRQRPSWDRNGGIWYVSQVIPKDGTPTPMYRHKPSIGQICGPLMGTSIRTAGGCICSVRYPEFSERLRLYREGMELVVVFKEYADLFTLALYRRQVCEEDIQMDVLFFNLALEAGFQKSQWDSLAQRMPECSWIRGACERRARFGELIAAE